MLVYKLNWQKVWLLEKLGSEVLLVKGAKIKSESGDIYIGLSCLHDIINSLTKNNLQVICSSSRLGS